MSIPHGVTLLLYIFLVGFSPGIVKGQEELNKYWVLFTDKNGINFDPYSYFDIKAIERRLKSNIPINHISDWPVKPQYIDSISALTTQTRHHSRWFNAVAILANAEQLSTIKKLNFIKEIIPMSSISYSASLNNEKRHKYETDLSEYELKLMKEQTTRMGGHLFEEKNIKGKGIRIAIFDAGFPTVDVNPAFKHIRENNNILQTKDFLTGKENVYKHSAHGTNVLSCVAGIIEGERIGMATEAEFLLARTESGLFEPYSEEENWLAASEWADKNGADIISSSLGYTNNRYFTWEMDGKKSLVAKAANMAARKGMLVLNAAGNDGESDWKYQGTPADADSVLSVGGIDAETDYHIYFSSFGPSADKRMKPNICAFGQAVVAGKRGMELAFGTSFSAPLASGFAACAWQTSPNRNNMEMFNKIEQSADLYPYYDYAHGYGVPQAYFFLNNENKKTVPTYSITTNENILKVVIDKNQINLKKETKDPIMYYHIENPNGYLDKYYVVAVKQYDVLRFDINDFQKGSVLRVFFKGHCIVREF